MSELSVNGDEFLIPLKYPFLKIEDIDLVIIVENRNYNDYDKIISISPSLNRSILMKASEVFKLKNYVEKIRLLKSCDIFLIDEQVNLTDLGAFLGNRFYSRDYLVVKKTSINEDYENYLKGTHVQWGMSVMKFDVKIGNFEMDVDQILENLKSVMSQIFLKMEGEFKNPDDLSSISLSGKGFNIPVYEKQNVLKIVKEFKAEAKFKKK